MFCAVGDDGGAYSVYNIYVSIKKMVFHILQLEIGQY